MKIERHFQYSHDPFVESARNRLSLRGRSARLCGSGFAGKPVWDEGFPASSTTRGKPGCARRGPLPPGGVRAAREGRKWRERPPFLPPSCGTGQGNDIHVDIHPFSLPQGRSLHSDPCGKARKNPTDGGADAPTRGPMKWRYPVGSCCFSKGIGLVLCLVILLAEVTLYEQDMAGAGCQGAFQRVA